MKNKNPNQLSFDFSTPEKVELEKENLDYCFRMELSAQIRTYCKNNNCDRYDLLKRILDETHGCTRRMVVNISNITERAKGRGLKSVSAKEWQKEPLSVGRPPKRSQHK
ncbi:MAG: hypothetical protein GY793_04680 [Proteobacteria bacterium]|nr:hypothetical protein [Pseudomonadota bacterium]